MNKKIIVLVGPPCSGKSTIGKEVIHMIPNTCYVSSGDIARRMAKNNMMAQSDLDNGKLAPECLMRKSISSSLYHKLKRRDMDMVILDGFPRFGEQAEWLRKLIPSDIDIYYVLVYAKLSTIIERSNARGRSDDKSLEQRFKYYYNTTLNDLRPHIDCVIDTEELTVGECIESLIKYIKSTEEVDK